jgi:hypothetical protein
LRHARFIFSALFGQCFKRLQRFSVFCIFLPLVMLSYEMEHKYSRGNYQASKNYYQLMQMAYLYASPTTQYQAVKYPYSREND